MGFINGLNEYEMNKFRQLPQSTRKNIVEQYENAVVVNADTGELIKGAVVKPDLGGALPQQVQYAKRASEITQYNEENGGFVFTFYNLADHIGNELTKADLARLLFLATHLTYNGNILKFDNGVAITKKNMPELLGLKNEAFNKFYKTVTQLSILVESHSGERISMCEDYFYKGSLPKNITEQGIAYTRTYVKGIRYLYAQYGTTRKAGQLGLLYLVIPYIHKDTNILATNTDEQERRFIEALTLEEVANILGYTPNKVTTALTSVILGDEYVFMITQVGNEKNVVVNPRVFWRGKGVPQGTVDTLFQIKKHKNKKLN